MTSWESSLRETIFSQPIVDTHTHIWPRSHLPERVNGYDFFRACGYIRIWWSTVGYFSKDDLRQGREVRDWPTLAEGIRLVRNIGYYRTFWNGLKNLYGIQAEEMDEESFAELSEKLEKSYSDPDWFRTVLRDKAGLEVICQDLPGYAIDRSLLTPTARMDDYIMFGRSDYADNVIKKYGRDRTSTLDGLESCLRQDFEEAVENGAAAIKSRNVSARSLQYDPVDSNQAAIALAEILKGPGNPAEKTLGDYMMARVAELCAEHDIPLQIHTGPSGGINYVTHYGNPLELNSLLQRNPKTKFDLLHAGGPFVSESWNVATQFPNVTLDLCGIFAKDFLRRILDEWIEFVPQGKLMWGTDINLVEEAYAVTLNFREVLSKFLADRVRSGYLSRTTAEEFAAGIMRDNALRILRLPKGTDRGCDAPTPKPRKLG